MIVDPTAISPRWWKSAMRAHVPEPQGAASTWPGPHTSAFGDTPCGVGQLVDEDVVDAGLAQAGHVDRAAGRSPPRAPPSRAARSSSPARGGRRRRRRAPPRWRRRCRRRPRCRAAPRPPPRPRRVWPGATTNDGVQRSVTSRTRSPSERATVSTGAGLGVDDDPASRRPRARSSRSRWPPSRRRWCPRRTRRSSPRDR